MLATDFQKKLVQFIEKQLNFKINDIQIPPQGMTSKVFFIMNEQNQEYAVKYGADAMNDVPAFELLSKNDVQIPVPQLIKSFIFEDIPVVILSKINFPLLESVPVQRMSNYIPSMINNQKKLHSIKSSKPELLIEPDSNKTWKEIMLSVFEGGEFDWTEVATREGLDKDLITNSVSNIIKKLNNTNFDLKEYSFLHTDFNQRNLFVDPDSDEITGIIDWEEAMFGDPIYDFARIRMYIWHFDLGEETIDKYYELLNYTPEEKKRDNLYWLSRVIQYLGWYSEELNEFNVGRIKLHQDFLRNYNWS